MSITTVKFWRAAAARAVRTAAQSALLAIGADQVNVIAVDWPVIGGLAAGGFALSILTSLAAEPPEAKPSHGRPLADAP